MGNSQKRETVLDDASSKLQGIRVELPNYSYYHSPFDEDVPDDRFIGRGRLKKRLVSLFSYNNSNSGAYLITGYRGMGKSSLIREVLHSMTKTRKTRITQAWVAITMIAVLMYLVANVSVNSNLFRLLMLFVSGAIIGLFFVMKWKHVMKALQPRDRKHPLKSFLPLWISSLSHVFTRSRAWEKHRILMFQIILAWLFLYLIPTIICVCSRVPAISGLYLIIYLSVFFWVLTFGVYGLMLCREPRNLKKTKNHILKWYLVINAVLKSYINNSSLTMVHINLNLENLRELDVMNLLAKEIYKKFKHFSESNYLMRLKRVIHAFLLIFMFFVLAKQVDGDVIITLRQMLKLDNILISQETFHANPNPNGSSNAEIKKKHALLNGIDTSITRVFNKLRILYPLKAVKNTYTIDYLMIALLIVYMLFFRFLFFLLKSSNVSSLAVAKRVLQRLKLLNDRIDSIVIRSSYSEPKLSAPFWGGNFALSAGRLFSTQKVSPIASAREIELELIDILKDINQLSEKYAGPQLIVVFDEIDKIEPKLNVSKDSLRETEGNIDIQSSNTDYLRARQEMVFTLLSNLKHLLTTAKARFVFIAGREMFDAAQADVSDRNFFIKSIFCQIINVDSFMSDRTNGSIPALISTTEEYLCRFLMPLHSRQSGMDKLDLRRYNEHLKVSFEFPDTVRDHDRYKKDKRVRELIILSLRHFIVYLVYRSNGSPKKIASIMEEYVRPMDENDDETYLTVRTNPVCRGLHFGFYDLYAFSLINYLVNPLQLLVTASVKDFGDKIMVASSFLLDHIFKHHRSGFSWRDLESMPELMDVNKSPELREVLQRFLGHLSKIHLKKMRNGLYDFTFTQKIVDEISYLCKVNTNESAALNFTLDESLSMKRYYYNRLRLLNSGSANVDNPSRDAQMAAIIRVSNILADIHYNDEEYHECILLYSDVCNRLKSLLPINSLDGSQHLQYLRALLKLAIVFEKVRNYDQALLTYNTLTNVNWAYLQRNPSVRARLSLYYQHILARLHLMEKSLPNGIISEMLIEAMTEFNWVVPPKTRNMGIRIEFYRRLANVLYFKNGVPSENNLPENSDISSVTFMIDTCCASCRIYSKNIIGILLGRDTAPDFHGMGCISISETVSSISSYLKRIDMAQNPDWIDQIHEVARNLKLLGNCLLACANRSTSDISGFMRFMDAAALGNGDIVHEVETLTIILVSQKHDNKLDTYLMLSYMAAVLYRAIGAHREEYYLYVNIMFTMCKQPLRDVSYLQMNIMLKKLNDNIIVRAIRCLYRGYSHIHRAEIDRDKACFVADSILDNYNMNLDNLTLNYDLKEIMLHKAAFELNMASLEIKEILEKGQFERLKDCQLVEKYNIQRFLIDKYSSISLITNRILEMDLKSRYNYLIFQVMGFDAWFNTTYVGLSRTLEYSTYIDGRNRFLKQLIGNVNTWFTSMQCSVKNYDRIIIGSLREDETYKEALKLGLLQGGRELTMDEYLDFANKLKHGDKHTPSSKNESASQLLLTLFEHCVCDSIFCLDSAIKHIMIKGISFKYQYSLLANLHYHLGVWCHYLSSYAKFLSDNLHDTRLKVVKLRVDSTFGQSGRSTLSPMYHYEIALDYYYKAFRAHQGGDSYRDLSQDIFFLNDDLDSDVTHFAIGFERFMLGRESLKKRIRYLHKMNKKSVAYQSEYYELFRD